MIYESIEPDKN